MLIDKRKWQLIAATDYIISSDLPDTLSCVFETRHVQQYLEMSGMPCTDYRSKFLFSCLNFDTPLQNLNLKKKTYFRL